MCGGPTEKCHNWRDPPCDLGERVTQTAVQRRMGQAARGVRLEIVDLINAKREHLQRLSTQRGAAGELAVRGGDVTLVPRPKGKALQTLLAMLRKTGVTIKASSFDAISLPDRKLDFADAAAVEAALPDMVFIEVKTANQV